MKSKKPSVYTRDLSAKQTKTLQKKHSEHLKRTRQGFLSMAEKKRLLKLDKWEKYTTNDEKHRYFYEIRERARTGFGDFLLLFDTLSDSQIKEIFENEMLTGKNLTQFKKASKSIEESDKFWDRQPTFFNMLNHLFKDRTDDDTWQAHLSYYVVIVCTRFLREHNFISTKAHERLLDEVENMINVEISRGTMLARNNRFKGFA